MRFLDTAVRLAGFSAVALGWRPDEFWNATPAELAVVIAATGTTGDACASATDLARLMEIFPDG